MATKQAILKPSAVAQAPTPSATRNGASAGPANDPYEVINGESVTGTPEAFPSYGAKGHGNKSKDKKAKYTNAATGTPVVATHSDKGLFTRAPSTALVKPTDPWADVLGAPGGAGTVQSVYKVIAVDPATGVRASVRFAYGSTTPAFYSSGGSGQNNDRTRYLFKLRFGDSGELLTTWLHKYPELHKYHSNMGDGYVSIHGEVEVPCKRYDQDAIFEAVANLDPFTAIVSLAEELLSTSQATASDAAAIAEDEFQRCVEEDAGKVKKPQASFKAFGKGTNRWDYKAPV